MATLSYSQPLLKLGTVNELTLNVAVENRARDAAYRAVVVVTHPAGIGYIGLTIQNQVTMSTL